MVPSTPKDLLMPTRPRLVLFGHQSDADTVTVADVLRRETVGGLLMLAAAAVALVWASSTGPRTGCSRSSSSSPASS
jgi:NhaA family Na+:H+ antiporter